MNERWLSASKVAQMLGMSRSSVWRLDRETLPYITTAGGEERPGQRRYRPEDVQRLLDQQERTLAERVAELEERVSRLEER